MDYDIFDIQNWKKTDAGENSHEERFQAWLTDLSEFTISNSSFENDNVKAEFRNNFRVSGLPNKIEIKPDHFINDDPKKNGAGSLFTALLADWDAEDVADEDLRAKYEGTSIVFFPCYKQVAVANPNPRKRKPIFQNKLQPSGVILALGMGSGGPGPDDKLVTNPGHIRRFEGLLNTIKTNIDDTESLVWFRNEPALHKPIPESYFKKTKELFCANPNALELREDGGYGEYIYCAASLKFNDAGNFSNNQKNILKAFIKFYARERGWKKNTSNDPAIEWYNSIFGSPDIKTIKEKLVKNKYLIIAGPPGIRKSDFINEISNEYGANKITTQFHPNITYQSFVGGIQPTLKNSVGFEFYKGHLIQAIENASKLKGNEKYLLVIDEINRADLSSVLGEAVNLFEPKQSYPVTISNYLDDNNNPKKLTMPDNLHVLCAMNTADRSISSIDVAIRRRFAFINLWPTEPESNNSCGEGKKYFNELKHLFLEYGDNNDLNLMPGGYYFLGHNEAAVKETITDRLMPLLSDYMLENRLSKVLIAEIELFIQKIKLSI